MTICRREETEAGRAHSSMCPSCGDGPCREIEPGDNLNFPDYRLKSPFARHEAENALLRRNIVDLRAQLQAEMEHTDILISSAQNHAANFSGKSAYVLNMILNRHAEWRKK